LLVAFSTFYRAFIDDIIIFSNTVFNLFTFKNIVLFLKKSFIIYPNVELFGFKVNILGLLTTNKRIAAFWNLEFPNTLKLLEQYIGVLGFIRYFILYYVSLIKPL
ncbi:hypothetical protein GE21DRAFT_1209729, partial [Neurospora crassa]